ncbi:YTH domain-containing protein ECT2-like isoform X2 [Quercus lobata]|uniref:YTH domain-containing family protein n=1 Tax=Quercus lobata TaxID=97700 RepID=A0A7N2KLQ8_QUELO|nr:YTH domain-containing protein ECT2-like isoform X2 [Quercus lobata]
MATVAPLEEAADLQQDLSLDSQTKASEVSEPAKKPFTKEFRPYQRSATPLSPDLMDPTMHNFPNVYSPTAHYSGGYDGTGTEGYSNTYPTNVNPDGMKMASGVYGENWSLMHPYGYGYAPYDPYSVAGPPFSTMGNGDQLYGHQHYQYPHYFQSLTTTSRPHTPSPVAPSQEDVTTSMAADQKPLTVETSNVSSCGGLKGKNGSAFSKPTFENSFLPGSIYAYGYQDPRSTFDGVRYPVPRFDGPVFSDEKPRPVTGSKKSMSNVNNILSSKNQNFQPNSHFMGFHDPILMSGIGAAYGFMNNNYPYKFHGHYGNIARYGMGFGYNSYDMQTYRRGYLAVDPKYKHRGRVNGYVGYANDVDCLNELKKGPRGGKGFKNQNESVPTVLAEGQNLPSIETNGEEKDNTSEMPDQEQFNREDFPGDCTDAKFFIIKSYSEDDVHKSIKYNVWASTPNGNKKLQAAYQEAGCPVFLLFSVNTSGQFVGLAEMVGPVDFDKNVEYWQQDKWEGCFPVKWHIVKDIPNSLLKHIALENNDNKPVTNSRDTQEVKLEQGLKMIAIFKEHPSKTSILDDFGFYEDRQKKIQEMKTKQKKFLIKEWEGKPTDQEKEGANGELKTQIQSEVTSDLIEKPIPNAQTDKDLQLSENISIEKLGDAPKDVKPVVSENRTAANEVANGC